MTSHEMEMDSQNDKPVISSKIENIFIKQLENRKQ
jgi:hypothetical protein